MALPNCASEVLERDLAVETDDRAASLNDSKHSATRCGIAGPSDVAGPHLVESNTPGVPAAGGVPVKTTHPRC